MDSTRFRFPRIRLPGAVAGILLAGLALYLLPAPAAQAAGCLEYEAFFRRGGVFPNPFNNYTQGSITGHMTVLVVDEDLNMHLVRFRRTTYNINGQTVAGESPVGTYESRHSLLVPNLWDGRNNSNVPVASGIYRVRFYADSTVCGRQSHDIWSTVLH